MKSSKTRTFIIDMVIICWNVIDTKIAKEENLKEGTKNI